MSNFVAMEITQRDCADPIEEQATGILKKYFGYHSFRPLQLEIIRQVVAKRDTVVLMPTGGGKSLCFQIPALMQPGLCLVISPLISLMKDQVESLRANGVPAAFLNSSQTQSQQQELFKHLRLGNIKLLYISPERLMSSLDFIIDRYNINMIAVDEAHCISSWGHDFRPEYTQLKQIKSKRPDIPLIALTATADKVTRKDIVEQLGLDNPQTFLASFDRPNLSLEVRQSIPKKQKDSEIISFILRDKRKQGIIYCSSRKNTEQLAIKLRAVNIKAAAYHAGLANGQRDEIQEAFIRDKIQVICATIAFGMGIDKPDVRFVIHYNLPKNMEGYYQEIGRAGRDGLPSHTILYYGMQDVVLMQKFARDSGQRDLNMEKLNRMRQYASAPICRRKVLLSYFGEQYEEECGNCDVCQDPPEIFDGAELIQKAISALYRTREGIGRDMLINILRGINTHELTVRKYHLIKTFATGRDLSFEQWQYYITQMVNMGIMEVAYDENYHLKVTPLGRRVVLQRESFNLARMRKVSKSPVVKVRSDFATTATTGSRELFEHLRELRKQIATEAEVPAYVVFPDKTLQELAQKRPTSLIELGAISGIGQTKLERYGDQFLDAIGNWQADSAKHRGDTYKATKALYDQGLTLEEMAKQRNLQVSTIGSHLATLYLKGEAVDLFRYITPQEVSEVEGAVQATGQHERLQPIYEHLGERIGYPNIRMALSILEKMGKFGG